MKLYVAEGAFGGFKWQTDYYNLDNRRLPSDRGQRPGQQHRSQRRRGGDAAISQAAGGKYLGTIDWRIPSFETLQPDMLPVAQQEVSLGAEKKLSEDLSFSARGVWKHLLRTIEDIGIITPEGELYYEGNPGSDWIVNLFQTLQRGSAQPGYDYWDQPEANRDYYGLNLSLEKRFSHNWQGSINYTLSLTKGNYGGLSSTDEFGRNSPNVERSFDLWFMMYADGRHARRRHAAPGPDPLHQGLRLLHLPDRPDPRLRRLRPQRQPHLHRGCPSTTPTSIPTGTVTSAILPFTTWADIYAEWAIRIGGKYTMAFNAQVNNITNTKTWQQARYAPTGTRWPSRPEYMLDGRSHRPETDGCHGGWHSVGSTGPYYWVDRHAVLSARCFLHRLRNGPGPFRQGLHHRVRHLVSTVRRPVLLLSRSSSTRRSSRPAPFGGRAFFIRKGSNLNSYDLVP